MKDQKQEINIEELKKQLEECQKQKEEYLAGWQRERADFLNYKKEEMARITGLVGYASQELIIRMLPILDNLDMFTRPNFFGNYGGQGKEKIDKIMEGITQIRSQFTEFLKSQGIEEIKSVGEKFDPKSHEVVEEVEPAQISSKIMAGREIEPGLIVEEIQKGYKINGELLRPARVKVTK